MVTKPSPNLSRSMPPKSNSSILTSSSKKASWNKTVKANGEWKICVTSWNLGFKFQPIVFICSKFRLGTSAFKKIILRCVESTSSSLLSKETMVKSTLTNGSSKASVSTLSQSFVSCLILVLDQISMPFISYTSTWSDINNVVVAVVKSKLISPKRKVSLLVILWRQPSSLSTRWAILQIKPAKVSSGLTLCYQVLTRCSDGKLLRVSLLMSSSEVWHQLRLLLVQKLMSTWPKTESCVFRSTSRRIINIIWLTFLTPRLSLMLLATWPLW